MANWGGMFEVTAPVRAYASNTFQGFAGVRGGWAGAAGG